MASAGATSSWPSRHSSQASLVCSAAASSRSSRGRSTWPRLDADDALLPHADEVGERLLAEPELHPALGHARAERLLVHVPHAKRIQNERGSVNRNIGCRATEFSVVWPDQARLARREMEETRMTIAFPAEWRLSRNEEAVLSRLALSDAPVPYGGARRDDRAVAARSGRPPVQGAAALSAPQARAARHHHHQPQGRRFRAHGGVEIADRGGIRGRTGRLPADARTVRSR